MADILAGFFIVKLAGLDFDPLGTLPYMLVVSACLYLSGMAWNDLFDAEEDARLRPSRPIPAAQITMTAALYIAAILAICGLMLAMVGGLAPFLTASTLLLMIFLYNAVFKHNSLLGPFSMGACRGLNLFLGMCGHSSILLMTDDPRVFLPPLFLTAFTAVITVISRLESDGPAHPLPGVTAGRSQALATELEALPEDTTPPEDPEEGMRLSELRRKRDLELLLRQNRVEVHPTPADNASAASDPTESDPLLLRIACITLVLIPAAGAYVMAGHWLALVGFGALLLWLALPLSQAVRDCSGPSAKKLVGAGILGICLLDASFVACVSQAPLGHETLLVCAAVAGMIIPASVLRRYISVT